MRCETRSGTYQCDMEKGHAGPCETEDRSGLPRFPRLAPPVDRDAQRELARAAERIVVLEAGLTASTARIEVLEAALRDIKQAPCDAASNNASCLCCLHDRAIATEALGS